MSTHVKRTLRYVVILTVCAMLTLVFTSPGMTAGPSAPAAGKVFSFRGNGAYAFTQSCDYTEAGFSCLYLDVQQGGSVQTPQTLLQYAMYACDLSGLNCTSAGGIGLIPNDAFVNTSSLRASLNIDLSTLPDFYSQPPGSAGVIQATWNRTALGSYRSNGTSSEEWGDFITHRTGQYEQVTARVAGTVNGSPIPASVDTRIGTRHEMSITIQRRP
jgi:hypothetical protein